MRILHINTEKTWRGGEQQLLYLIRGLREKGHSSTLVCQPGSPTAVRAEREGFPVKEIRMRGGFDPFAVFHVAGIMREGYDIIHLHTANAHSLGVLASWFDGRPKIVSSRRVSFPIRNIFRKWKYVATDSVIAVSEAVRKGLIDNGIAPEKVITIHSAVDLTRFARGQDTAAPGWVVGTIAHLAEHKGHKYLFEAAQEILAKIPDVKFLVAGDGEMRIPLEAMVQALGLSEHVTFLGFQDDVARVLSQCTITVLPSISGEGSPGVIKESMAAGVPPIATDVGGSTEIIKSGVTGLIVPAMDSKALAGAIITLLTNEGLRKKMSEAGVRQIEEFRVERMVERTEAVYRGLLK